MSERRGELQVGRQVGDTRPAVASASIVLVRDGAAGLEVFMLERHIETDFAGGALVFPGGKLEPADADLPPARWTGIDPATLAAELGAASTTEALAFHVAAVREAFEEAGVLLARRADGTPIGHEELRSPSFADARARLAARDDPWDWREWLEAQQLVLDLGALAFFSWWATPDGLHRRYDTRFFVAAAPPEQLPALRHDDVETTSSVWIRPADALAAGRAGRYTVVFPTRRNLHALTRFRTAGELLTAAREGRTDRRRIQPVLVEVEGEVRVQHPDGGPLEPG